MLFSLSLSPVIICLFYIYIRDKYEKEPIHMLLTGVIFGVMVTFPIMFVGNLVTLLLPINAGILAEVFFIAFVSSSFVEEIFKFIILFLITWNNPNLNEKFDGIVYAVFISLGFASIENVLYVFSADLGGVHTAISRAVFSVPGHALFGVVMGYYYGLARLSDRRCLPVAFTLPWLTHAVYNLLLLWDGVVQTMLFYGLFVGLIYVSLRKMKKHLNSSPFRLAK